MPKPVKSFRLSEAGRQALDIIVKGCGVNQSEAVDAALVEYVMERPALAPCIGDEAHVALLDAYYRGQKNGR